MRAFILTLLSFYVLIGLAILAIAGTEAMSPGWANIVAFPILALALVGVVVVIGVLQNRWPTKRPKPVGYVGKFRCPDGVIVHVGRLGDGELMVASDNAPGTPSLDLGSVTGRELATWTKLTTTPDG